MKFSIKKRSTSYPTNDRILPHLSITFFNKPVLTAILWILIVVFGGLSYTTFLKREGFPKVNIPISIISGTYFVNDPAKIDGAISKPISDLVLSNPLVKSVQAQSADNFFVITVKYKDGADAKNASIALKQSIEQNAHLPQSIMIHYNVPYFGVTGGDSQRIDAAVSFYSTANNSDQKLLIKTAREAVMTLRDAHIPLVQDVFLKDPIETVTDPQTGRTVHIERRFDRFGIRQNNTTNYFPSVLIGFAAKDNADVIKLDSNIQKALKSLEQQPQFSNYKAQVSASFAPSIKDNISELQRVLLEGLLAILVIGSLVITVRASFITIISMISVLLTTIGFLYLIGYSLNVITLFALILGLALIVDDTIIMIEAIDAARRRSNNKNDILLDATGKISRAMVAATTTAALCFLPLAFVSGVLGSFIRAIPITLVASLIISLFVALIFIPFFARFTVLSKKQLRRPISNDGARGLESRLAHFITRPMVWARHSKKKLIGVILGAVVVGLVFITSGLLIARNLVFNIFPPTKNTNGIILQMQFPHNTSITKARAITANADIIAAHTLGKNFVQSSYYESATAQSATEQIQIISYNKRKTTSPELVSSLQKTYDETFHEARISVSQTDVGPPSSLFNVQINASNRDKATALAHDIADTLTTLSLTRTNGTVAHLKNVSVSNSSLYLRSGDHPIVTVSGGFDANDTSTLVSLAQRAVTHEYSPDKISTYGLDKNDITFDIGQESDNQNSFKTLALAFPILLVVIFVVLAIEFRSLLQPLLIFLAIPFSIFGVMMGLKLTHNPISFFAMLGFFALIGLSI
ncbi:MAG: hypothetical protein NVSMB46_02180 [Candidatus Saccharimonadales bacterium]